MVGAIPRPDDAHAIGLERQDSPPTLERLGRFVPVQVLLRHVADKEELVATCFDTEADFGDNAQRDKVAPEALREFKVQVGRAQVDAPLAAEIPTRHGRHRRGIFPFALFTILLFALIALGHDRHVLHARIPQVALLDHADAAMRIGRVGGQALDSVPQRFGGSLTLLFFLLRRKHVGHQRAYLHELHQLVPALPLVFLATQNRGACRHARAGEPRLQLALEDRKNGEVAQHELLEAEPVLHVQPAARSQESEVGVALEKLGDVRPEVDVQVAPAREVDVGRECGRKLGQVLLVRPLLLLDFVEAFGRYLDATLELRGGRDADFFLPHIRRVADHRIKFGDDDLVHLTARPAGADRYGENDAARHDVEEIFLGHERIVLVIDEVARGEVHRRQMGRVGGNVRAEELVECVGVRKNGARLRREVLLAGIGPDKERAATAGGVHDVGAGVADAEGVDEVHDLGLGVVLAVTVALFRADEPLENRPDHVVVQRREVESFDRIEEFTPRGYRVVACEGKLVAEVAVEDRLIVAADPHGVGERHFQRHMEGLRVGDGGTEPQQFELLPAAAHRQVEDDFVDQHVARELGGALQVVALDQLVIGQVPTLGIPHPTIEFGLEPVLAGVLLLDGVLDSKNRAFQAGFEH